MQWAQLQVETQPDKTTQMDKHSWINGKEKHWKDTGTYKNEIKQSATTITNDEVNEQHSNNDDDDDQWRICKDIACFFVLICSAISPIIIINLMC